MLTLPIRSHTILFTEACPLECRYCYLKDDSNYNSAPNMTYEQVLDQIKQYDKQDDPSQYRSQLLFTGGEPFLYWDWIKSIMDLYGNRFEYSFNTSGYCFTKEILEYLAQFKVVNFVLSIDGTEQLTNYLRPMRGKDIPTGYFKKLKTIIPILLYYFPKTPYRIIINPRYIDLIHQCYLEAEKLGFKYFNFILDFETRPEDPKNGQKEWTDANTAALQQQFDLIAEEIIQGFIHNISRPRITITDQAMSFLLEKKTFSPDNLPCQLFNGRSNSTLYSPEEIDRNCMDGDFSSLEECKNALMEAYLKTNGICEKDCNCPAFEYCALYCCPKNSLTYYKEFFKFDSLECIVNRIGYNMAIQILTICNELCPESRTYRKYINSFNYAGKEGVLMQ